MADHVHWLFCCFLMTESTKVHKVKPAGKKRPKRFAVAAKESQKKPQEKLAEVPIEENPPASQILQAQNEDEPNTEILSDNDKLRH